MFSIKNPKKILYTRKVEIYSINFMNTLWHQSLHKGGGQQRTRVKGKTIYFISLCNISEVRGQ